MPQAIPVGPLVIYLDDGPPTTSDDSATIRARRGYWWVDRTGPSLWACVDPAEGAAVWYRLGNAEDLGTAAEHSAEDFAPAASVALLPVVLAGPDSLHPADEGCLVLSEGHAVTLPASEAPGMHDGWRCVIKNTAGEELDGWGHLGPALAVRAAGVDQIAGQASVSLPAGASALVVRIAPGHYAII